MSRTRAVSRPDFDDRTESVIDWIQLHSRHITIALAAIGVLALGAFLYTKSREKRDQNAARMLSSAAQALGAGNQALAQSDLERVIRRYDGTSAATQATLLLAQLHYDKGEYEQGIRALEKLRSADGATAAAAEELTAAGFEQQGKSAEAAAHYRAAADKAPMDVYKANYLASAARAYQSAGNTAEARKLWSQLAAEPGGPHAGEARLRLGELTAKAAASG